MSPNGGEPLAHGATSLRRATLAPALVVLAIGLAHAALYAFPFEDSFITYRYSEHLAGGLGLVYNAGEVVEGFTSFAWTVLLAGLSAIHLPLPSVACVLSMGFGLALLWLTRSLARVVLGRDDAVTFYAPLLVAANGTWAYYAATGMETLAFAVVLNGALLVLATRRDDRGAVIAGSLLSLSALLRPEGVGYFGVLFLLLAATKETRPLVLRFTLPFVCIFAPYFAWRFHHFGFLLPNTFYAKAETSSDLVRFGAGRTEAFFTSYGFWLVPLAWLGLARRGEMSWPLKLTAVVVVAAVIDNVVVGGDCFAFYRFLLPAIPAGVVAITAAGAPLLEAKSPKRLVATVGGTMLVGLTILAELFPANTIVTKATVSTYDDLRLARKMNLDYLVIGAWLKKALPEGAWIATNAAGIVPYVSGLPTIDMLGLADVHIAHAKVPLGRGMAGHEKHDGAYVLSRKPDAILLGFPILTDTPPTSQREVDAQVAEFAAFLPGDRKIYASPAFAADYRPVIAQVEPGRFFLFFVRRETKLNGAAAPPS